MDARKDQPVFAPCLVMRKVVRDIDSAPPTGCRSAIETFCYSVGEFPWVPDLEVIEEQGCITIHVDLPGTKPEDIFVTVAGNRVQVAGERRRASDATRKDLHAPERTYGRFSRTVRLPDGVNAAGMTCRFEDGVLQISVCTPPGWKTPDGDPAFPASANAATVRAA